MLRRVMSLEPDVKKTYLFVSEVDILSVWVSRVTNVVVGEHWNCAERPNLRECFLIRLKAVATLVFYKLRISTRQYIFVFYITVKFRKYMRRYAEVRKCYKLGIMWLMCVYKFLSRKDPWMPWLMLSVQYAGREREKGSEDGKYLIFIGA